VVILTVLTSGLEIVGVSEFQRDMVTGVVLATAVVFNQRGTGSSRPWRIFNQGKRGAPPTGEPPHDMGEQQ
jgi:hypothetical protein